MGTLKSTLKLESTDLFPTPVSFTVVNNNVVNGTFSGFNTVVCSSANTQLNIATIDGTGAYLYAQSVSSNGTAIAIGYTGQSNIAGATGTLVYLSPGDVALIPVGVGATALDIVAFTVGGNATLNYFLGEK
ncbi:hypothetical protein EBU94_01035 [bacterium]|nr:hypothetical protein [bacterium]